MGPAAQGLYLFLELQHLSLELSEPDIVGVGPAQFVLNGLFQGLVTGSEFADPGI